MAKRTADPCIFCTHLPCTCDDDKPKAKAKGKRLPTGVPANTTTVELPADDVLAEVKPASSRLERMRLKAAEDAARMPTPRPVEARTTGAGTPATPRAPRPVEAKQINVDKVRARIASTLDEDTVVLNGAIRALAPLLSDEDRAKYAGVLDTQPSLDEEKLLWKARHRERQSAASS